MEGADADHGAEERGEDGGYDHRHAEDGAEAGEAKHGADDGQDGDDQHAEQQAGEGALCGGSLGCAGCGLRRGGGRGFEGDGGSAKGTELPGFFNLGVAF